MTVSSKLLGGGMYAGLAGISALTTVALGAAASPFLAVGLPVALIGGVVLVAAPLLGLAALVFFSHLDSIEKLMFGFLPVSAFKLLTAATLMATLLTMARYRASIVYALRDPVIVFAFIFALLSIVSFLLAEERGVALTEMRKNASLLALLFLTVVLVDDRNKMGLMLAILVGTSLISAIILVADTTLGLQLVAQSDAATTAQSAEGFTRSSGASDQNPTTAASMLLVGVVLALVHVLETPRYRLPLLVVVVIGSGALVLSFARSAALAYVLVILALAYRYRLARYAPLAVVGVLVAGVAALPLVPPEYWQRIGSIASGQDWTLGRRLSYNLIGLDLLIKNPLFGVGPGNFPEMFTNQEYRYYPGRTLLGRELHNMYLSILSQYGLIGGSAFLAMLAAAMKQVIQTARAPATPEIGVWALGFSYAFGGYLITSLFLPNEYTKYTWIMCGICAALYRINQSKMNRLP